MTHEEKNAVCSGGNIIDDQFGVYACGSTQEATALPDDANESIQDEEDEDLQNDPNDGLGGDLNEDTVMISAALRVSGWEKRTTTTTTWSLIARGTGPFT